MVEVKLQPCQHEICLGCCNAMRANVVFKADAGLKCPFCRDYVDGFTDMQGCAAARSPARRQPAVSLQGLLPPGHPPALLPLPARRILPWRPVCTPVPVAPVFTRHLLQPLTAVCCRLLLPLLLLLPAVAPTPSQTWWRPTAQPRRARQPASLEWSGLCRQRCASGAAACLACCSVLQPCLASHKVVAFLPPSDCPFPA